MRLLTCSVLVLLFVLSSCSRMSEDELFQAAQAAYGEGQYQQAAEYYEQLIDRFPAGTHAEESLFLLANMYGEKLQDQRLAIATHRRLRKLFPAGGKAPASLFLIGFIFNNQLHEYDSARVAYEDYLAEYPTGEMASSAQFELANLGKSPEELFKPLPEEKKAAANSPATKSSRKKR